MSKYIDLSDYSIEERMIASVWVHDRHRENQSLSMIKNKFEQRFGKKAPTDPTLLKWEEKAFKFGSVLDAPRSGRRKTRTELSEIVENSVNENPTLSLRDRGKQLSVNVSTLHNVMTKDLQLKSYKPMIVNELSDEDMDKREIFSKRLLTVFNTEGMRKMVYFSDECAVYLSYRSRRWYFWSKTNPHFYEELRNKPPHVMIWAAISSEHLIGPYFFDTNVDQLNYTKCLTDYFIPELTKRRVSIENVYFQQDGRDTTFCSFHPNIP